MHKKKHSILIHKAVTIAVKNSKELKRRKKKQKVVMVTRSSTGTSLISILEKGKLLNSERGKEDGVEVDKEGLKLGEEHELPSGLICMAMSLLERAGDTLVPASLKPSNFSPIIWNQHKKLHIISTKVYSFKIT